MGKNQNREVAAAVGVDLAVDVATVTTEADTAGIVTTEVDTDGTVTTDEAAAVEADATPSATTATAQVTLPGTAPRATGDAGTDCTSARNHNYSSHHNIILNNNLSKSFFSHFKVLSPQQ